MKKLLYLFIVLFVGTAGLYAQSCSTGFCPSTILVHHKIGDLSAATGDYTYTVVTVGTLCWIAQNLGAQTAPTGFGSYGTNIDGWTYVAGNPKGVLTTTVNTSLFVTTTPQVYSKSSDPCALTFGSAWHIPTSVEWANAATNSASWTNSPRVNNNNALYRIDSSTSFSSWASAGGATTYYRAVNGSNVTMVALQSPMSIVGNYTSGYENVLLPVRCVKNITD